MVVFNSKVSTVTESEQHERCNQILSFRDDQSGAVGPLYIMMVPALILILSLVIDLGLLFVCKNLLAMAADMAALAAAQEIDLELLALGERYIIPDAAETVAHRWAEDNAMSSLQNLAGLSTVEDMIIYVTVYNASKSNPIIHEPIQGIPHFLPEEGRIGGARELVDPTVCVTLTCPVNNGLLLRRLLPTTVTVHADASVMERKE